LLWLNVALKLWHLELIVLTLVSHNSESEGSFLELACNLVSWVRFDVLEEVKIHLHPLLAALIVRVLG
jgi:hypothetical protein